VTKTRVLVADPPWKFGDSLPGKGRGAAKHYPCLTARELMRFPLPEMADDSLLVLWKVAAMPQEALDVARAWGFTPKSELVWQKLSASGKHHFGMGHYVRASHETALICTRGRFKVASRSVRSTFEAPIGLHSAKPERFYAIVEELAGHGPYVELFGRRLREGWTVLGNEVETGPHTALLASGGER
jgi:site-specific DNA-methyltransferase (adenine-specific)